MSICGKVDAWGKPMFTVLGFSGSSRTVYSQRSVFIIKIFSRIDKEDSADFRPHMKCMWHGLHTWFERH